MLKTKCKLHVPTLALSNSGYKGRNLYVSSQTKNIDSPSFYIKLVYTYMLSITPYIVKLFKDFFTHYFNLILTVKVTTVCLFIY